MFNKEMINSYADKLLIGLSEEETNTLLSEFDVIKDNMEILAQIENIKDVKPMHFPVDIKLTSLRSDDDMENLDTLLALKNSEDVLEDVVSVPKVVG